MVHGSEMLAALCGTSPERAVAVTPPVPLQSFSKRSLGGGGLGGGDRTLTRASVQAAGANQRGLSQTTGGSAGLVSRGFQPSVFSGASLASLAAGSAFRPLPRESSPRSSPEGDRMLPTRSRLSAPPPRFFQRISRPRGVGGCRRGEKRDGEAEPPIHRLGSRLDGAWGVTRTFWD